MTDFMKTPNIVNSPPPKGRGFLGNLIKTKKIPKTTIYRKP